MSFAEGPGPFHEIVGNGPPLYVLGGIHLSHDYLRPWLDGLADRARLVYIDHRGTGRSPTPDDFGTLDHATWTADIDRLAEELQDDRILLFGHSYGGFFAQEYAARYPERLAGLILANTSPAMDFSDVAMERARARATPEQFETLLATLGGPVTDDSSLERAWNEILPVYFQDYDPDAALRMGRGVRYSAEAFNRAFFGCLPSFDTTERLPDMDVPALVLAGRHDWIMPPGPGAERLHAHLPDSELVIFEESGHFPFVEETGTFVEIVGNWLDRRATVRAADGGSA